MSQLRSVFVINGTGQMFDDDGEEPLLMPTEPSNEIVYPDRLPILNETWPSKAVEPPLLIPVMQFGDQ